MRWSVCSGSPKSGPLVTLSLGVGFQGERIIVKIIKCICLVSMGLILAGFSPSIMRSVTEKDDENAKLFEPEPARALVYVFRDNSFLGQRAASQLVVNNVPVTKNERNQFSVVSLASGTYNFFSYSSGESSVTVNLIHNKSKSPITVMAEPGKIYYFQEVFKPMGGFILKTISEEEAKPKIRKCKLAALHQL